MNNKDKEIADLLKKIERVKLHKVEAKKCFHTLKEISCGWNFYLEEHCAKIYMDELQERLDSMRSKLCELRGE